MMCKMCLYMLVFSTLATGCTVGIRRRAVTTTVRDGQIVLLRTGANSYGAFIPTSQRMSPEQLRFTWYYREDGKGTFKRSETAQYKSGSGSGVSDSSVPYLVARFGPFSLGWSALEDGQGHVYYPHFQGEDVSPDDDRICVTSETDIGQIDATDTRWAYKGSPTDPGITANGERVPKGR